MKTKSQLDREIAAALAAKSAPKQRSHAHEVSWKQIADQYKQTAKSAKAAGGKVKISADGSVLVIPTANSSEYFFQEWQGDELVERTQRENKGVLDYIGIEDLILAQSQNW